MQEVIVQNFLPKPGTAMHRAPAVPERRVPPGDRRSPGSSCRPRSTCRRRRTSPTTSASLLDAGIDDWGGVSPVTADHVNPERPWPALDRLREVTEAGGFALAPRLTIYPEFALDPERWLDAAMRFPVLDRSDAEGLGRDDPGAVFPERVEFVRRPDEGADVEVVGRPVDRVVLGRRRAPAVLVPAVGRAGGSRGRGARRACCSARSPASTRSSRCSAPAAPRSPRSPRSPTTCAAQTVGDVVTFVRNRNINYTNVCTFKCRFCGFSKGPLSLNLRGTPYLLTLDDIQGRVRRGGRRWAPPRCACRAASTPTSTATTTSTSPGR